MQTPIQVTLCDYIQECICIHIYACNNSEKGAMILKKVGSEWYLGEFLGKKWKGKMLQFFYNFKIFKKLCTANWEIFLHSIV